MLSVKSGEKLVKLARSAVKKYLANEKIILEKVEDRNLNEKRGVFVTLNINNELRGCIGSLEARQELWKDVIENAIHAGFHDFRFPQLKEDELKDIKIEVSVLTKAKEIKFKTPKELLDKIDKNMGLILENNGRSATFLPQVWHQLEDKGDFLEALSLKAGLLKDNWKTSRIFYYRVEVFKE